MINTCIHFILALYCPACSDFCFSLARLSYRNAGWSTLTEMSNNSCGYKVERDPWFCSRLLEVHNPQGPNQLSFCNNWFDSIDFTTNLNHSLCVISNDLKMPLSSIHNLKTIDEHFRCSFWCRSPKIQTNYLNFRVKFSSFYFFFTRI